MKDAVLRVIDIYVITDLVFVSNSLTSISSLENPALQALSVISTNLHRFETRLLEMTKARPSPTSYPSTVIPIWTSSLSCLLRSVSRSFCRTYVIIYLSIEEMGVSLIDNVWIGLVSIYPHLLPLILCIFVLYRFYSTSSVIASLFQWHSDSISPDLCIFKSKSVRLVEIQKQFRVYPFIPVEYDLVYDVFEVLQLAPSWGQVEGTKPYTIKQSETSVLSFTIRSNGASLPPRKEDSLRVSRVYHVCRSSLAKGGLSGAHDLRRFGVSLANEFDRLVYNKALR